MQIYLLIEYRIYMFLFGKTGYLIYIMVMNVSFLFSLDPAVWKKIGFWYMDANVQPDRPSGAVLLDFVSNRIFSSGEVQVVITVECDGSF